MSLYSIKCSNFTGNKNIEKKHKTDGKINFYPSCIECDFKKFETIDKEKLSDCLMCRKNNNNKKQNPRLYVIIMSL